MAAARESLSPLIRNVNVRRLSLELCQKLGNQLLSPSRAQPASNECYSPLSKARGGGSNSPFKCSQNWLGSSTTSPKCPNSNRRCSLGCGSPMSLSMTGKIHEIRRGSLNTTTTGSSFLLSPLQFPVPSIYVEDPDFGEETESSSTVWSSEDCEEKESPRHLAIRNYHNVSVSVSGLKPEEPFRNGSEFKGTPKRYSEKENLDPDTTDRVGQKRRKSSPSSRYDLDDSFTKLIAEKCQLFLNPNKILGRGSFGTVVSGLYQGRIIAAKTVQTKTKRQMSSIRCEQNALDLPSHPNVTRTIDIFQFGPERAIVVLERLRKGNLLTILNGSSEIRADTLDPLRTATEIASALRFCHTNGILHLDVKPQNILMDFEGNCKLTDFGNSRRMSDLMLVSNYAKLDGTVQYKAPELFCGHPPTDKADVYSYGITLWQLLTHEIPYQGENEHSIIYKVVAQGYRPSLTAKQKVHFGNELKQGKNYNTKLCNYKSLYEHCWAQEPSIRPDMKSIVALLLSF